MSELPATEPPAIVVTASRAEETADNTPATVTLVDAGRIERLAPPQVADLLRLIPSVSIASSGPAGSLTQVRIRGAEANHTLLFVEGIRANDPAAGNEPRFELLNADLASRIEVVRGPQSALWGSEAIGGVVALSGPPPGSGGTQALVEGGSRGSRRGAARAEIGYGDRGMSLGIAAQRSDGIDSFIGGGEKDGYKNIGLRGAARYRINPGLMVGASGFALRGRSEFDGYNAFFLRDDTLDETHNRLAAVRLFAELGSRNHSYAQASASLLGSSNRNQVAGDPLNRTEAKRRSLALEGGHRFGHHRLIAAVESERETFEARDAAYGGFTNQDRSRGHQSITAEWRADQLGPFDVGLAVRHDIFSRFKDATSIRASLQTGLGRSFSIAANYGEGIAQPSFFDLYGFFPGSFIGNADLKPESSRSGEVSLRYRSRQLNGALTYYRQHLKQEIVGTFDPLAFLSSTVNASGRSERQGIEFEADYRPSKALRLSATYAWLDASEPKVTGGQVKEQRRPKHSGSVALDGSLGRLSYGAAIAYAGARDDTDFDIFPSRRVRLGAYWLANARIAYRLTDQFEAHVRVANAFGDRYQDAVGYRTEGRSVHAGLRVAVGR
ncbi:MAG TPA: TonB-dependent receptor [Sphingomicrobium sp.]|nr:TonB-dependent receptor [Sphingomicrobium sp.]